MSKPSSKSGPETKSTSQERRDNVTPNLNPGENIGKNTESTAMKKKRLETKLNTKKEETKKKSKGKLKGLKAKILEGSPMASNIMGAFKKFFVAYLSVMRKLSKDWGFDISDLEKSQMAQKMDKSDKLDKIQEALMKKTKMEKISKEDQLKLRTKTMLDPSKNIGLFMFNGLGIKPPALPPKKAHEKNKKPKPTMYLDMLMVQLKASGFKNAYHDQSIVDGMLKANTEGKRKFYKGDPIFFRSPDGHMTAGFLEGFKDGKFIIQTTNLDGSKTILKEIHQKHVFTAFHVQGNRVPISSPKPVDVTPKPTNTAPGVTATPKITKTPVAKPTTATPAIQKKSVNKPVPKPITKPTVKPPVKPKITPAPIKSVHTPKPETSKFFNINAGKQNNKKKVD
jgi:hypothetical protein